RHPVKEAAVASDNAIAGFCQKGKARKLVVKQQGPLGFITLMQQMEDRFCAAETPAVGADQPHRFVEFFRRQSRKLFGDVLRWDVIHSVARPLLPVPNPDPAKRAVAVVNKSGTRMVHS